MRDQKHMPPMSASGGARWHASCVQADTLVLTAPITDILAVSDRALETSWSKFHMNTIGKGGSTAKDSPEADLEYGDRHDDSREIITMLCNVKVPGRLQVAFKRDVLDRRGQSRERAR